MNGRTDGRSGPTTRPAFAKVTQVKNKKKISGVSIIVSNSLDPSLTTSSLVLSGLIWVQTAAKAISRWGGGFDTTV